MKILKETLGDLSELKHEIQMVITEMSLPEKKIYIKPLSEVKNPLLERRKKINN
jgi:hypothetical protein